MVPLKLMFLFVVSTPKNLHFAIPNKSTTIKRGPQVHPMEVPTSPVAFEQQSPHIQPDVEGEGMGKKLTSQRWTFLKVIGRKQKSLEGFNMESLLTIYLLLDPGFRLPIWLFYLIGRCSCFLWLQSQEYYSQIYNFFAIIAKLPLGTWIKVLKALCNLCFLLICSLPRLAVNSPPTAAFAQAVSHATGTLSSWALKSICKREKIWIQESNMMDVRLISRKKIVVPNIRGKTLEQLPSIWGYCHWVKLKQKSGSCDTSFF